MFWVFISITLAVVCAILFVLVALVIVQILLAVTIGKARSSRTTQAFSAGVQRPRVAVIIPAHNESTGLLPTLDSFRLQLAYGDQVVVVADNCTDDTAQVARQAGATALERMDKSRRGKGYALDFGVRSLEADPPAFVMFCDADVKLRTGAIDELVAQAMITSRPAQGIYVLYPSKQPNSISSDFASYVAVLIKNHVRPLGWRVLGGPCTCTGAGIVFDYATVKTLPLASGNIVEDMAMSFDLASRGKAALLCPTAFIDGELAPSTTSADKQRRRWGHGHLQTIFSHALPALFSFKPQKMALGLDVVVFPLTLLMASIVAVGLLSAIAAAISPVSWSYAVGAVVMLAMLTIAVIVGYVRFDHAPDKLRKLATIPGYMLRKLILYVTFFGKRETAWNRTDRAG